MALKPYIPPKSDASKERRFSRIDDRQGSSERGYDANWTKVRKIHIDKHPYCARCGKLCDVGKQDSIVDHIIPVAVDKSKLYDLKNLQTLCRPCHAVKTFNDYRKYPNIYLKHYKDKYS